MPKKSTWWWQGIQRSKHSTPAPNFVVTVNWPKNVTTETCLKTYSTKSALQCPFVFSSISRTLWTPSQGIAWDSRTWPKQNERLFIVNWGIRQPLFSYLLHIAQRWCRNADPYHMWHIPYFDIWMICMITFPLCVLRCQAHQKGQGIFLQNNIFQPSD